MTVPGNLCSPLLATAAAAAAADGSGAIATKSLRFNDDDQASLSRTPSSAGNRRTFTYSCWFKRANITRGYLFSVWNSDTDSEVFAVNFSSSHTLNIDLISKTLRITDQVFRDPSAWYHLVLAIDTTQSTASDRLKLYINGSQVTNFSTNVNFSQNDDTGVNGTFAHQIGRYFRNSSTEHPFDGYMTDIYLIDGLQLTPTSFGSFDSNGVWQAAAYSGTFGTNGFYLGFGDSSDLGADSSGNNNDFTANNFSTTAGAGNDVLFDVPTNGTQTDTGAGGEVSGCYCVLNPLDQRDGTLSNGNLDYDLGSGTKFISGTIAVKSGKWFWEAKAVSGVTNGSVGGRFALSQTPTLRHGENGPFTLFWHATGGIKTAINGTITSRATGTNYADGDVLGLALDADANIAYFYKNGSLAYTYDFSSLVPAGSQFLAPSCWNGSSGTPKWEYNFGQRAFAHSARSNHKVLCTASFGTPTIADGSDHFEAKLYTSETTISGLSFSPGLVWLKRRSAAADNGIYDVVRGVNKLIYPNASNAEETGGGVTAFNSDGFDLGTNALFKGGGHSFVSWNWYAGSSVTPSTSGTITATSSHLNSTAGFNILKYNGIGDGSTETLGHSLSSAPELIWIKCTSNSADWAVYHKGLGAGGTVAFNSSSGKDGTSMFAGQDPTSSIVHLKENSNRVQTSGRTYVAYLFHSVDGFSSIGSYEGTGSASTGAFVFCGFRPALVLIKRDGSASWCLYDTSRDPFNDATHVLNPNNNAGGNGNDAFVSDVSIDILSNGFKIVDVDGEINQNGDTYIYYAVAENAFSLSGGLAR
tara:strand:- start:503 stop:2932 length:2430 start_codon:yes stop_codon:yes gene_type:complete